MEIERGIFIWIHGKPVSWKTHGGFGKHSFDRNYKNKKLYRIEILSQFRGQPLTCAIKIDVTFFMKIPKSIEKRAFQLLPIKRPPVTNLYKFLEHCLKGIVFKHDSQVVQLTAKKIYAGIEATDIHIMMA